MRIKLSRHFVEGLRRHPEDDRGYQRVDLHLADGRVLWDQVVSNNEYVEVADDHAPVDIVRIRVK